MFECCFGIVTLPPNWIAEQFLETTVSSYSTSQIAESRRDEIIAHLPALIDALKLHRANHKAEVSQRRIDLGKPAWVRVNPGPPIEGDTSSYRLCVGFQNVGCKYREDDELGLGCLNCGYYARTAFRDTDSRTIVEQFKTGLMSGSEETKGLKYNSVEFLNDGSFLNPAEFDRETQTELFGLVHEMPHVRRVLVESRAEYVSTERVRFLLSLLREDQALEVGVGLESVDDFVRDVCINKGFSVNQFEDAVQVISGLAEEHGDRISLVVYLIVKPAFLSHDECIRDIVGSLKYLYAMNRRVSCRIVPKLEPAVVADGTLLSMLYTCQDSRFWYEPLSYWAVLEIIATVACEMRENEFEVRIGAREDMDDVVKAPAVYREDGEAFHPFDFVIYESVQKFNQHQNWRRLFAVIDEVYRLSHGVGLTESDSAILQWMRGNGRQDSAAEAFFRAHAAEIAEQKRREEVKRDVEMMLNIYGVLDVMEGYRAETGDLKRSVDEAVLELAALENGDDRLESAIAKLEGYIAGCFQEVAPRAVVRVRLVQSPTIIGQCAEVPFDVTDLLRAERVSVWSRFSVPMAEGHRPKDLPGEGVL